MTDASMTAGQPVKPAKYGAEDNLDPNSVYVRRAAHAQGIPTKLLTVPGKSRPTVLLQIDIGQRTYFYAKGVLSRRSADGQFRQHINSNALATTHSKAAIKALLAEADVLVPAGRPFVQGQLENALAYGLALDGPVCVKPDGGRQGRDVYPNLTKPGQITAALEAVFATYTTALVEQSVSGEVIRFFYVEPDIVGTRLSRAACVVGDGRSSVGALIEAINAERRMRRLSGHDPVVIDERIMEFFTTIGVSLETVPASGQQVPLSPVSNISRGGGQVNLIDEVHHSHRHAAARAFAAIPGLRLAANDMMIPRPSERYGPDNGWTLEINSSPSIDSFHAPWEGEPQDIAGAIVRFMMRDAEDRISAESSSAPTTGGGASGNQRADQDIGLVEAAASRAGLSTSVQLAVRREGGRPRPYLRIAIGDVHFHFRAGMVFAASSSDQDTVGRNVNGPATRVAASISKTRTSLDRAGLPIPPTGLFTPQQLDMAGAFARALSGKVCIRPDAANADGLFVDSDAPVEIEKAVASIAARQVDIVVEQVINGAELEFLCIESRIVALTGRLPVVLRSDGRASVLQLIHRYNDDAEARIHLTSNLVSTLARQSLDLGDVPAAGAHIVLGTTVPTRQLIEPDADLSLAHESYGQVAHSAVTAIDGLALATVVLRAVTPGKPAASGNHRLIRIDNGLNLLPFSQEEATQRGDIVADELVRWMIGRASAKG